MYAHHLRWPLAPNQCNLGCIGFGETGSHGVSGGACLWCTKGLERVHLREDPAVAWSTCRGRALCASASNAFELTSRGGRSHHLSYALACTGSELGACGRSCHVRCRGRCFCILLRASWRWRSTRWQMVSMLLHLICLSIAARQVYSVADGVVPSHLITLSIAARLGRSTSTESCRRLLHTKNSESSAK